VAQSTRIGEYVLSACAEVTATTKGDLLRVYRGGLLKTDYGPETKNPAGKRSLPGRVVKRAPLMISPASGSGDALSPQSFTFFSTTVLARLLVAFFQLQALEQAIVLNFFLQNPHGFFEIVVEDFDFNCFQTGSTPFFSHRVNKSAVYPWDGYFEIFKRILYQIKKEFSTKKKNSCQ